MAFNVFFLLYFGLRVSLTHPRSPEHAGSFHLCEWRRLSGSDATAETPHPAWKGTETCKLLTTPAIVHDWASVAEL